MFKFQRALRSVLTFFVALLLLLAVGCDSSGDDSTVTITDANTGNAATITEADSGSTLTVNLDTEARVNARVADTAASFLIQLFDPSGSLLADQTAARGQQQATFSDLASGDYIVRIVGLDAGANIVGYFDRRVSVTGDASVAIDSLVYTDTLPAPGSQQTPFVAFEELPDSLAIAEPFTLSVAVFNADGTPATSSTANVELSITGGSFSIAPSTTTAQSGVATFSDLFLTPDSAGPVVITATATDSLTTATPELAVTADPPFNFVVVGDFFADAVYLYDLSQLQNGNNDIAPSLTFTGANTANNNYGLEPANNGRDLWFSDATSKIQLFTDFRGGGNQAASLTLQTGQVVESLSFDDTRNILYSQVFSGVFNDDAIHIYDEATTLTDGADPTRILNNFSAFVSAVEVDPTTDRLFVVTQNSNTPIVNLHIFDNASTLNGDQTAITHQVTELIDAEIPFGLHYDRASDRLWLGDAINDAAAIRFVDRVSSLGAGASVNRVLESGDGRLYFFDVILDPLTDRLYATNFDARQIWVYFNASQITGSITERAPDITIGGDATLLQGPDGITLVR